MSYKNILFDLDGTISNNFEGITNSIYHSLTYYPHIEKPERDSLLPFIGPPLKESFMKFYNMDEEQAEKAVEKYGEISSSSENYDYALNNLFGAYFCLKNYQSHPHLVYYYQQ